MSEKKKKYWVEDGFTVFPDKVFGPSGSADAKNDREAKNFAAALNAEAERADAAEKRVAELEKSTLGEASADLGEPYDTFRKHIAENVALFDAKQRDYGSGNIGESFNNFGITSLLVRMNDKMQRAINLNKTGDSPSNESMEDTMRDLANYAIIAIMCMRGEWPGVDASDDETTELKE